MHLSTYDLLQRALRIMDLALEDETLTEGEEKKLTLILRALENLVEEEVA